MTSEAARHALYARLKEVLGGEHADTLMTSLPMETANRLATKDDIDRLEDRMADFAAEIRSEVREMRKEAHTQFRNYTITTVGAMTALTAIFGVIVGVLG
ncbi:MAG TPA: hypothetical protein EYP73_07350 [Acidimicrobiia bacterium]|nr:hypothetical protein [Acidimicrobiia bacterium]